MRFNIPVVFFVGVLCCWAANGTGTTNTTTNAPETSTTPKTTTATSTATTTSSTTLTTTYKPTKNPTSNPTSNPTRSPTTTTRTTTKRSLQVTECLFPLLLNSPSKECLKLAHEAKTHGPWSEFVTQTFLNDAVDFCFCLQFVELHNLTSQSPKKISDIPSNCFKPYKSQCKQVLATQSPTTTTVPPTRSPISTTKSPTMSTTATSRSSTNTTTPITTTSTSISTRKKDHSVIGTQPSAESAQGNLTTFLMIGGVIVCLFGAVLYCLKSREAGDESLLNRRRGNAGGSGYDRQSTLSQDSGSDTDENLMMPQQPRRQIGTEVVGALSGAIESIASKVPRRPKPKKHVVVRPPSASGGYQAARDDDVGTELTGVSVHQTPKFGLGDSDDEESSESDEELLAIAERRRAKKREREMKKKGPEKEKKKKKKKSTKSSRERDDTAGGQDFDPRGDGGDLFEFAPDCDE